jgi:hypothetical protein
MSRNRYVLHNRGSILCRGKSFWIPRCADQLRSPSTLKFRNKAVGFLTDKFYTVALCLGTGTKMYQKESSRSFSTLHDQGHFCTSVGVLGTELPNSDAAQLFSNISCRSWGPSSLQSHGYWWPYLSIRHTVTYNMLQLNIVYTLL